MFGPKIDNRILRRAMHHRFRDQEICGFIDKNRVVRFRKNIADDPANEFKMNPIPDGALAIFHSHPNGPFYPSGMDMQQQKATALPWGIACFSDRHKEVVWFDESKPSGAPLIGRGFRHGVTDCYELVRDFYHEVHGVSLPSHPRSWEWWDEGENLYAEGFKEAGFHEISLDQIQPGDAFMATIRSKAINHAGVYLGNGLILHHTCGKHGYDPSKLSVVEPAARWFNFVTKVVRHEDNRIDRTVGQGIWPPVSA